MLDGDPCEDIIFNDFDGDDMDAAYEYESIYPRYYKDDHIEISGDLDWGCYHIITKKYHVCWYLASQTFAIIELSTSRNYDVILKGNLDRFFKCEMIENDFGYLVVDKVISAAYKVFDDFVDRIWNLKAFS